MSNEKKTAGRTRSYTLKARARRQQQVHRRITLAAVHLHQTVGPARTTMAAIAELAGVQRATVYNHFATDLELIEACSSHWFIENPPPDPSAWTKITDPHERTEAALTELYAYYERGQAMLGKVLRDVPLVPALEEIVKQKWQPFMQRIVDVLMEGRSADVSPVRATLRVAVDYSTWELLTADGLTTEASATTAASWGTAVPIGS